MFGAKSLLFAASAALALGSAGMANAAMSDPMVGGAMMYPSKNIIQNAINSPDHTTLVAAVKAAGLVDTLEGAGPFTVFAPTNEAFAKLPAGAVDDLLKPENKGTLVKVLTYHVVPGTWTTKRLMGAMKSGGGHVTLTTAEGEPLIASMEDGAVYLTDVKGGKAMITVPNVIQSNGVIQVIDTVLMP
jgi:uncharacterized surface protein with fasciclin (FAS1) repeats